MKDSFSEKNSCWDIRTSIKLLIFLIITLFFVKSIIWGRKGFIDYQQMCKEIYVDKGKIRKLKSRIKSINAEIDLWQKDDFMVEKSAREDLQMVCPSEKVYILEKTVA